MSLCLACGKAILISDICMSKKRVMHLVCPRELTKIEKLTAIEPTIKYNSTKRVIIALSGGIASAWCAWYALQKYPKEDINFLFHDTLEEDEDTYRFLIEFAQKVKHPIIEKSSGYSVTSLAYKEHTLPNNRMAFCSRILKGDQRDVYISELQRTGVKDITLVLGFTPAEMRRSSLASAYAVQKGYKVYFPLITERINKFRARTIIECHLNIKPPRMYAWAAHANCVGCVRGGKNYWLAVKQNRPDIFLQRMQLEEEFNATFIPDTYLKYLNSNNVRLQKREKIEIGSCECGDAG